MKIGFGKGTIKFPLGIFPLEGFCGIHDDPHIRVMVIDGLAAIAAAELVNMPRSCVDYCRKTLSETFGIPYEQCLVPMTHAITTPHEPGMMGPPDRRPPMEGALLERRNAFLKAIDAASDEAIAAAEADMKDCTLGVGKGECLANRNRDVEYPEGWWTGFDGTGPSDREMTVIRADGPDGKPAGIFVSYGIKPCAIDNSEMEKNTRLVSSECCGMACTRAEEIYGCPVLFAMSAAGDQIPVKATWIEEIVDGEVVRHDEGVAHGFECASEVADIMLGSIRSITDGISCDVSCARAAFVHTGYTADLMQPAGRGPSRTAEFIPTGEKCLLPADIIRIGTLCFVAGRPEMNAVTGMELKKACPGTDVVLMSFVNEGFKYLPDISGYERVTFECKRAGCMPGSAEKWVEAAAAAVNASAE